MIEVEFKGWCERDNEWRYGHYLTDGKIHEINTLLPGNKTLYGSKVDINSIGQYTGLRDKNSLKIFSGDIINIGIGLNFEVEYILCCYGISTKDGFKILSDYATSIKDGYTSNCIVIGNKYFDEELLK